MRIIQLGNIDFQFCCTNCHTIFEVNTKELIHDGVRSWHTVCPLCGETIRIGEGSCTEFLSKRAELEKELNK